MKIGFFTDSYMPFLTGVTSSVESSAKALEQKGHEVYIIAPKHPRYKDHGKNVYRLTSIKILDAPEVRFALHLPEKSLLQILRIDFDIIHGHAGGPITLLGWQTAKLKNIPYVATYHTLWNKYTHYIFRGRIINPRMFEITSKLFGNVCDCLIAPTERVKKELTRYGIKKPIYVLPSGINLENYNTGKKGFLRNKYHISNDTKILLYVGRLGKEKSVDFLIKAFRIIHQKYENSVLMIVGSGAEKSNLTKLVKEYKLQKSVYFCGNINHSKIPLVYADADLFVFASKTETQGLVVNEALASGLPVVVVKDETYKDAVINNKNGFLTPDKPEVFADKAVTLLSDSILYEQFSLKAQQTALKFSAHENARQLEKIYKKLIAERSKKVSFNARSFNLHHLRVFISKARAQLRNYA